MGQARKYLTFKRVRMTLFELSYAGYVMARHINNKYKKSPKFSRHKKIPEISLLIKCLNFDYQPIRDFVVKDRRLSLVKSITCKRGIKQYLAVENELVNLVAARQSRSKDFYDPDYETEAAILQLSIERAAGNHISENVGDRKFNKLLVEKQNEYRRWYYKIAYHFKLPTIRITPFILRLIKS